MVCTMRLTEEHIIKLPLLLKYDLTNVDKVYLQKIYDKVNATCLVAYKTFSIYF